jgi:hypothetical protein
MPGAPLNCAYIGHLTQIRPDRLNEKKDLRPRVVPPSGIANAVVDKPGDES